MKFRYLCWIMGGCVLLAAASALAKQPSTQQVDQVMIAVHGGEFSAEQAADLEKEIRTNPDDLTARIALLGYYNLRQNSATGRAAFARQVLWIIANRPRAKITGFSIAQLDKADYPKTYERAKSLWAEHVQAHPKDVLILSHAASFLEVGDTDIAVELYKRCEAVDPKNPDWPDRLANNYQHEAESETVSRKDLPRLIQMISPLSKLLLETAIDDRKELAAKALAAQELSVRLTTDPLDHFYEATALPNMAIDAGDFGKAKEYARALLKEAPKFPHDWNYGNAIFYANIALGRASLHAGGVNQAAKYLLAAGKTPGSCQLDSFGPKFGLADQLLKHGRLKVVIEYLDEVSRFWGTDQLAEWKKQLVAGKEPDFGSFYLEE